MAADDGPPQLTKAPSFFKSASSRLLSKFSSKKERAGPDDEADANGKGVIGTLLSAIGVSKQAEPEPTLPHSASSRLTPSESIARGKLMTSQSRGLARLSSVSRMRSEVQQYGQFNDLRNDSFSMPNTIKLAKKGSTAEAVAASAGSATGMAKAGSMARHRLSSPGSLLRGSAPGMDDVDDSHILPAITVQSQGSMRVSRTSGPGSTYSRGGSRRASASGGDDEHLPPMRRQSSTLRDRPPTPRSRGPSNSGMAPAAVPAAAAGGGGVLSRMLNSFRLPDVLGGGGVSSSPPKHVSPAGGGDVKPFAPAGREDSSLRPRRDGSILAGVRPSPPSTSKPTASPFNKQRVPAGSILKGSGASVTGHAPSSSILHAFHASGKDSPSQGMGPGQVDDEEGVALAAVEAEFDRRFGQAPAAVPGAVDALAPPSPPRRPPTVQGYGDGNVIVGAGARAFAAASSAAVTPGSLAEFGDRPDFRGGSAGSSAASVMNSKLRLASIRMSYQEGIVGPSSTSPTGTRTGHAAVPPVVRDSVLVLGSPARG